jgi:Tol biopolymer transport system component
MGADGSHLRRLTDGPGDDRGPAWSPDGTMIAFSREAGASTHIWLVTVDGVQIRPLTSGPLYDVEPSWQPLPLAGGA